jgi:outer membrane murein-binding lipoprotein Lpp
MRSKVSELSAMVDNLEAQVINLRTRKAAKASPRTKPSPEAEDMAGLDPEEAALFRDAGIM